MICIFLESSHWELSENDGFTLARGSSSLKFQNYNNTRKLKIEIFQSLKSATDFVAFHKITLPKIYILFLKLLNFFVKVWSTVTTFQVAFESYVINQIWFELNQTKIWIQRWKLKIYFFFWNFYFNYLKNS